MTYVAQTWQDNNHVLPLSAARMQHIEDGLAAIANNGSLPAAKYRLVSDGVTVTAYDQTGASVASGTDGGAVLTAVLPAASSAGAIIELRNDGNVFPWATVPTLPAEITNKLLIRGNSATVQLSVAGPRFLDFAQIKTTAGGAGGFSDDATITVASTASFASTGVISLHGATAAPVHYTGKTATTFTGCTCTSHTAYNSGDKVTQANQTFQHIELTDLTVDCNNVGGRGHVVIGNYYTGGIAEDGLVRTNYRDIVVRRVRAINLPVDSTLTDHRLGVYILSRHNAASEETTNTVRDILLEDLHIEGGNIGVTIGGQGPVSSIINIEYDGIMLNRCWHSLGVIPTVNTSSANFQVGVRARGADARDGNPVGQGGSVTMRDCFGEYSMDVGIEIDAPRSSLVVGTTMKDSYTNGFYSSNNTPVTSPEKQQWLWRDCTYIRRDLGVGTAFKPTSAEGNAIGRYIVRDCHVHVNNAVGINGGVYGFVFSGSANIPSIEEIDIDGLYIHEQGLTHVFGDSTWSMAGVSISIYSSTTVKTRVRLHNIGMKMSASRTGGGNSVFLTGIYASGPMWLDTDTVAIEYAAPTLQASGLTGIELGTGAGSSIDGSIRRFHVRTAWTGDTAPRGIKIAGTGTLTIPTRLDIENCDFTLIPAGGAEVLFSGTPQNQDKVYFRGNKWRVYPKLPVAMGATNFAAAAFTTNVWNQYIGGSEAVINFVKATGANITAIDWSPDNGTTVHNILTQAAGAIGASDINYPLDNGDYIRVVFATTQPTTNLRFRR